MDSAAHYGLFYLLLALGLLGVSVAVFTNKFVTPHSFSFIFFVQCSLSAIITKPLAIKGMFRLVNLGTREVIQSLSTLHDTEGAENLM